VDAVGAHHTATSPIMAAFGWLPGCAHIQVAYRLGWRGLGSGWRGRSLVGTASPDIGPTRDDHGALAESREPGKRPWIRAGPGRRQSSTAPCLLPCCSSRPGAAVCRWRSEFSPVSAPKLGRWARRVSQDGSSVRSGRRHGRLDVERLNDLKSDELLGRHQEVVGVALDRLEKPGR
jgi:hypothetical protein